MTGMIDDLIGGPWEFLTSNLVGLVVLLIAGGIAIGIVLSLAERFGGARVAIGAGALAAVAGAAWWYVAAPSSIEAREKDREKSAFDMLYEEARVRPGYELVKKPGEYPRYNDILLTVRESRNDYLVTSVYEGFFGRCPEPYHTGFVLERHTITIQDRNMQPFGRPEIYKMLWIKDRSLAGIDFERRDATGGYDFQPLIDGLSTGTITIDGHDQRIDDHLRAIRQFQERKSRYEAEYARRTRQGG
jgi:hypothetical protein